MSVSLTASHRRVAHGARRVGEVDANERAEVTVIVRRRTPVHEAIAAQARQGGGPAVTAHLRHEEFIERFGADPADLAAVSHFATEHGLHVVGTDAARRTVVLSGSLDRLAAAFEVRLGRYESAHGGYRGREGTVQVPAELDGVITAVLGLDDRTGARPHVRPADAGTNGDGLTAPQVGALYGFPDGLDGEGECVGIIELGGGYTATDLKTYVDTLKLPALKVEQVSVDGQTNAPSTEDQNNSNDSEVALDLQIVAAIAPKADLVLYFGPNTERGFVDVIGSAVHDTKHAPSVLSISWGAAEAGFTEQTQKAFDEVLADAALLGITVCCSTGDLGSGAGTDDGKAHVELPASSPHALACGGTFLTSDNGDKIDGEVVWQEPGGAATGGGISDIFDPPNWQHSVPVPPSANPDKRRGRGVPDVAGNAASLTSYRIVLGGRWQSVGGTSGVAPLMAGLVTLANQSTGRRLGWLNPALYGLAGHASVFREITEGGNGAYQGAPVWNACTGLGVPNGKALVAALATAPTTAW